MLRQTLAKAKAGIPNQLGKKTSMPTLRWVFQCFQSVHLLRVNGQQHISNLSDNRLLILRFLGSACQKYYLLCWVRCGMWVVTLAIYSVEELPEMFFLPTNPESKNLQ